MATTTKTILKTYFETGDKPTQAQFYELLDSIVLVGTKNFTNMSVVDGILRLDITSFGASFCYSMTTVINGEVINLPAKLVIYGSTTYCDVNFGSSIPSGSYIARIQYT